MMVLILYFLFVVLLYHIMKFCWCQHCSWLYSQTDPWDLKVLIFARNSFSEVELASLFNWAVSFVKNSLYAYQHKFINNKLYDQLNTLFKIHCQPLLWCCFSRIHLIILRASTRSNSKLSLRVTHSRYIRRRVWEMILRLTCFQVFYSLAYITQSDTFKRKFPSFSCSQENKPMSHLYFHRIESGVEYFTFFGSKSTIFPDVAGKVYQLSVLCHM